MTMVPVLIPCAEKPTVDAAIAPAQFQPPTVPPKSTPMPAEGTADNDGYDTALGLGLGLGLGLPLFMVLLIAYLVAGFAEI